MATTLFILNDPPYGTERSYNGLRLDIRGIRDEKPAEGCGRGALEGLAEWTQQADRVLVF
ncbi:MAG: hypothetical protein FJW79_02855 [Actinobacteria bacterium]|nr:hypothetical protein [Actinomycetota bacterium]